MTFAGCILSNGRKGWIPDPKLLSVTKAIGVHVVRQAPRNSDRSWQVLAFQRLNQPGKDQGIGIVASFPEKLYYENRVRSLGELKVSRRPIFWYHAAGQRVARASSV